MNYYTHNDRAAKSPFVGFTKRGLANAYRNVVFGTQLEPAWQLGYQLIRCLPQTRSLLDREARGLLPAHEARRVLDVGCGNGTFLQIAEALGWTALGVDFDRKAVSIAQSAGLKVLHGGIEALLGSEVRFDAITISHVLEHVADPRKLLRACYRLTTPGGRLWLETPNLNSSGHRMYGRHWRGLEPPRHLVLFVPEALRNLVASAGFQDIRIEPAKPIASWLFCESAAIRSQRCGHSAVRRIADYIQARVRASGATRSARLDATTGEYLTVTAYRMS